MTTLDDFIKEVNMSLFVHCLGEKITFTTINKKEIKGDFLSINPENMSEIIYHDDESLIKEKINVNDVFEDKRVIYKKNENQGINIENNKDEVLYFKIEDVQFNTTALKQAQCKKFKIYYFNKLKLKLTLT